MPQKKSVEVAKMCKCEMRIGLTRGLLAILFLAGLRTGLEAQGCDPATIRGIQDRLKTARDASSRNDYAQVFHALEPVASDPPKATCISMAKVAGEFFFLLGSACMELKQTVLARKYLEDCIKTNDPEWENKAREKLGKEDYTQLDQSIVNILNLLQIEKIKDAREAIAAVDKVYQTPPSGSKEDLDCLRCLLATYTGANADQRDRAQTIQCLATYLGQHPDGRISAYAGWELDLLAKSRICYVDCGSGILKSSEYNGRYAEELSAKEQGEIEQAVVGSDYQLIAFVTKTAANSRMVYVLPRPGAQAARIWSGRDAVIGQLSWSPAKDRLALAFVAPDETGDQFVFICGPGQSKATKIDSSKTPKASREKLVYRWSPDGQYLAFRSGANDRLRVVKSDGESVGEQLETNGSVIDFDWAKSPSGSAPVLIGFTPQDVFQADYNKSAFDVRNLTIPISPTGTEGQAEAPTAGLEKKALLLITSVTVTGRGRDRTLSDYSLSCLSEGGPELIGSTNLFQDPDYKTQIDTQLLSKIPDRRTGKQDITQQNRIVEVEFSALRYDPGSQRDRLEGVKITSGLRVDVTRDQITTKAQLKTSGPPPPHHTAGIRAGFRRAFGRALELRAMGVVPPSGTRKMQHCISTNCHR